MTDHPANLRAAAALLDEGACQCGEQFTALRGTSAVCRDAAAEIERLWAVQNRLVALLKDIRGEVNDDKVVKRINATLGISEQHSNKDDGR